MSGTMASASQSIISFNPHKNHDRWLLSSSPFYNKEINGEKWKYYTVPVFGLTLRFYFIEGNETDLLCTKSQDAR